MRVGVLPDQSEQALRSSYRPLLAYLSAATGLELELVVPASYDDLITRFESDLELAFFGGLTFLRAEREAGAEPLVMRDVDLEFTTSFLTARSAPGETVEGFRRTKLAFGPSLSTSGHLMPRYYLEKKRNIEPETFFDEVRYSAGHDQTAAWVQSGVVDIAAVNSLLVEAMFRDGRLSAERVRVLWTTPTYRNYVWAVQKDLDREVRQLLLDAFLALEKSIPEHAAVLGPLNAGGYVPASSADYDDLRQATEVLGPSMNGTTRP